MSASAELAPREDPEEGRRLAEDYVRGARPRGDLLAVAKRKEAEKLLFMLNSFLFLWSKSGPTAKGRVAELVSEMVKTIPQDDPVLNAKLLALVVLAQGDTGLADMEHIDRLSVDSAVGFVCDSGQRLVGHLANLLAAVFADMNLALEQAKNAAVQASGKPGARLPETSGTEPGFKKVAPIISMPSRPASWDRPYQRPAGLKPTGPAPALPEKQRLGVAPEKPPVPDDPRGLLIHLRAVGRSPRLDNEGELDVPQYAWEADEWTLIHRNRAALTALLLEEATNPNFKLEPEVKKEVPTVRPDVVSAATTGSRHAMPAPRRPAPRGEGLAARIMTHLGERRGQEVRVSVLVDFVSTPAADTPQKKRSWLASCIAKLIRDGHPIRVVQDEQTGHSRGYVLEGGRS